VYILPMLEQTAQYNAFDRTVAFQAASNQMAPPNASKVQPMKVYSCPADERLTANPLYSSYFGVSGGGAAPDCGNTGCSAANERGHYARGMLYAGSKLRLTDAKD